MTLRTFIFAFAVLPAITFAGGSPFDGNYSASVGPGPLKDLYILGVAGVGGTLTFAKALQKPQSASAVNIEQNAKRMTVTSDEHKDLNLLFEKSEKGLTCVSGCNAYAVHWETVAIAQELKSKHSSPAAKIDIDSLPAAELGNMDGAWIQSKSDPENANDTVYEIKGEFVKRYYFTYGLYPKSRTPDVFMVAGDFFIEPRSGSKVLQLRKLSETKLIAQSPQWKGQVFLYRADSIKFADLKKARNEAEF
ncbi:hypothetical protein [Pseudomonas sp. F1002]|uniref:hypothetical protein n=1 Tax=Pseudomonas sp. F1002 TaxID=2738821 RepID=UPI0015A21818|nr:hypothetical protein [Pseudomonas sp. F1002]NWB63711.1 hypothetical protein [Pseudomonas sp. F1002]